MVDVHDNYTLDKHSTGRTSIPVQDLTRLGSEIAQIVPAFKAALKRDGHDIYLAKYIAGKGDRN